MIWFWMIAISFVAASFIAMPFFRRRIMESAAGDATMSIYSDQIDEAEHDRLQGLISASDATAAVSEIERRRLRFARHLPGGLAVSERTTGAAIVTVLIAVDGGVIYRLFVTSVPSMTISTMSVTNSLRGRSDFQT